MKKTVASKPNLIYIYTDSLRYQSFGYNGDEKALTPNIDMLAKCSTVMDNCVTNHPLSSSYSASMLTGKYSTATGVISERLKIGTNHKTFAEILADNNYTTEFIGKWSLSSSKVYVPEGEERLGFNGFFASFDDKGKYYCLNSKEKISVNSYVTDEQTSLAIERLEKLKQSDKPFALFLNFNAPDSLWKSKYIKEKSYNSFENVEFSLPENYDSENDIFSEKKSKISNSQRKKIKELIQNYYAFVNSIDTCIGEIMQAIVELELDDNTVIVFTSSYGEMLGAHGCQGKNTFYDEVIRVPFIVRYGEKLYAGKNETCFGAVDIMPTVLSIMNIPYTGKIQGRDKSDNILSFSSDCEGQLIMGMGPSEKFRDSFEWRAYRTKQFTYAVYKSDNEEFLFDNLNDPYQTVNLIFDKNYLDIEKRIKDEMYAEMARINDGFEYNSYYKKH